MATTDPRATNAGRPSAEAAGERLSELFEEHGRMVYGLCRVLLRNADEAEDAAQQVFLSAHRNMLSGTEPREPAAWLAAIARHECHDRIRARTEAPLMLVVEERDAVGADVEQVAGEHAEVKAICAALAELPRQQRQAIVLREFYGLSYDEVRTALGITDSAVESLLFRARKRLQTELKPARVASGAIALPLALRESLASAVPGFSASSGGGLAKLASLPLFAKLAGATATLTAVGTIGFVQLEARDHDPAAPPPSGSAVRAEKGHQPPTAVRSEPISFKGPALAQPGRRVATGTREDAEQDDEDEDGAEPREREDEGEAGDVQNEAPDSGDQPEESDASQDDGSGSADEGDSGESDSGD